MVDEKPTYRACFESIRNPGERYPLDEVRYTDREGGLLQVVHDMDELKKTSGDEWKRIFQERSHRTEWPLGSGVWGKKEWVLREIRQRAKQVIWLNPENRMTWGFGDSEMDRYEPFCDLVAECRNLNQLYQVADRLVLT